MCLSALLVVGGTTRVLLLTMLLLPADQRLAGSRSALREEEQLSR
jgi:hypothetical protein